jgi:hypothetical protein
VSGSVRIGVGQVQSNRFSGAVEVVNEQRNHALGGRAFCGESTDSTGASNYCTTQLYNPPGSAVKAVVSKIQIADANGSDWTGRRTLCVGFRNAMATSLYAASRPFRNKLLGGVAPQSQSRKGMTSSGSNWWMWQVPMYRNGVQTITFEEPVIVSAGQDFTVMDLTGTNGPIFTTIYDFIELPA